MFSCASGGVTRADVERFVRERSHADSDRSPSSDQVEPSEEALGQPLLLLVDLLQAWSRGHALVLESGTRRASETLAPNAAESDLTRRFDGDRVLVELSTSGTTGRPERHTKTAAQLLGEAAVLGPLLGLDPESVVLSTVSLHHLYGLLFGLLSPLGAGARIVSDEASDPTRFHPHRVAKIVRELGVTHLVTIPVHIRSLLDAAVPLSGLRTIVSSAAPLPPLWAQELEQLSGARVLDVLGSTESGGIALRRAARDASYRPLPGVTVRASADGHLEVSSPFVGAAGSLATGDRVELRRDGSFRHLGRDDGIVKIAGRRFSLQELEQCAQSIPGVTGALAFARSLSGARATELWLVVESETLDRATLRAELARRVDPVLVPRRLRVLRRLPRDVRGKLPRVALERYLTLPGFDVLDVSWDPFRLEARLRDDSRRLVGHFPGAPVLPAVSQLLDLVLPEVERSMGAPVQEARRLKWLAPVLPGQVVVLTLEGVAPSTGESGMASDVRFQLASPEGAIFSTGTLKVRR